MFQLTITVNLYNDEMLDSLNACIIDNKLTENNVCASTVVGSNVFISIGGERHDRQKIIDTLKDNLVKIYLTVVKKKYIERHLKLMHTNDVSKMLITNMLVAFDRENEDNLLRREIDLKSRFSIDGFFNFRMKELKQRWTDVCKLATDNAEYLSDDSTVNELLKFLMCAVQPKISAAEISENGDCFEVTAYDLGQGIENRHVFYDNEQLMLYLIDAAPAKILLKGRFNNKFIYDKITSIFDGAENIL